MAVPPQALAGFTGGSLPSISSSQRADSSGRFDAAFGVGSGFTVSTGASRVSSGVSPWLIGAGAALVAFVLVARRKVG